MSGPPLFTWRHFEADIIRCAGRWYLRYTLSYRDVEALLRERGVWVDHTTILRWVHRRRHGSTQAYPMPHAGPSPAPSHNRMLQAVMRGMRRVVRGLVEGPRGRTVTEIFDRCRDAVTATGERCRAFPWVLSN
jgi:hypothetical protein